MKLRECKHGVLVSTRDVNSYTDRVGMVVGITNNCESADKQTRSDVFRAIPLVQWSDSTTPAGIHYDNLFIFNDF